MRALWVENPIQTECNMEDSYQYQQQFKGYNQMSLTTWSFVYVSHVRTVLSIPHEMASSIGVTMKGIIPNPTAVGTHFLASFGKRLFA